jgi:hypothetical protein
LTLAIGQQRFLERAAPEDVAMPIYKTLDLRYVVFVEYAKVISKNFSLRSAQSVAGEPLGNSNDELHAL